jgi:hypothetical protein
VIRDRGLVIAVMTVSTGCTGCAEMKMTRQRLMGLFLAPTVINRKGREGRGR